VALGTGFPYLWIDSLCIIQDDRSDWEHQSVMMNDIYLNSLITIAAHSYDRDGGSGFLEAALAASGDDYTLLGHYSATGWSEANKALLYARRDHMFEVDIFNSPLSSRGWILQERILSPRIIHFFHSQLYYESQLFQIVRAEDRTPAFHDPDKLRELIFRPENQKGATPMDWFRVVERYSACKLTQGSDKLLAIAGIAKNFYNQSGEKYLAGLFSDRAAKGLLWLPRGPNLVRVADRAPSWSWASVDGPIKYPRALLERPFRVLPVLAVVSTLANPSATPKQRLSVACHGLRAEGETQPGLVHATG